MKKTFLYIMSAFYILAGIAHFTKPNLYKSIVPGWLPGHSFIVYFSGISEMLYGLLLIPRATRKVAALLIIAFLIAVFPANIEMALDYYYANNPYLWLAVVRLPMQFVLVYWAYIYTQKDATYL